MDKSGSDMTTVSAGRLPATYLVLVAVVATAFLLRYLPETAGRAIGVTEPRVAEERV
jgi:hypothetical protein